MTLPVATCVIVQTSLGERRRSQMGVLVLSVAVEQTWNIWKLPAASTRKLWFLSSGPLLATRVSPFGVRSGSDQVRPPSVDMTYQEFHGSSSVGCRPLNSPYAIPPGANVIPMAAVLRLFTWRAPAPASSLATTIGSVHVFPPSVEL